MISIRPETPADVAGVRRVNELAFGRPDEVRLVDALRTEANPYLSLVAVNDEGVVGHVLLTPITVEGESADPRCWDWVRWPYCRTCSARASVRS